MLLNKLIEADSQLRNKNLIKQRIDDLQLRNNALWALFTKDINKDTLFELLGNNQIRITKLFEKVVDCQ